jgi:hypothetical protein
MGILTVMQGLYGSDYISRLPRLTKDQLDVELQKMNDTPGMFGI